MWRYAFACAALAAGLLLHGAARADPRVLHGRFSIAYVPIACVMAPCPPGAFQIAKGPQVIGSVRRVAVANDTPRAVRQFIEAASRQRSPIVIEGEAWLDQKRSVLVVRARRAVAADK